VSPQWFTATCRSSEVNPLCSASCKEYLFLNRSHHVVFIESLEKSILIIHVGRQRSCASLSLVIIQTLTTTGFSVSFYDDDMSPLLLLIFLGFLLFEIAPFSKDSVQGASFVFKGTFVSCLKCRSFRQGGFLE
jgi:hypothetical protein